ncbi:MAG: hypothetical protein ACREX5_03355 [Achromobacter pestifer]
MAESYEIVFQQVAIGDLLALLKTLEASSKSISDLAVSEGIEGLDFDGIERRLIDAISAYEGDVCLTELLHGFRVSEGIILPCTLLRAIKYNEGVDVELSFVEIPSTDICCVMLAMQAYGDSLSKKFSMAEFYGGLEPAEDVDTRYFTGEFFGPLGLLNSFPKN